MNAGSPIASALKPDFSAALRLEVPCEFSAVRAAITQICDWLAKKNLAEADCGAWELILIEAANNAVKYAGAATKNPILIEIICGSREVEARVTDHTPGFEWPQKAGLPAADAEKGRGLFLIQSLTKSAKYFRSPGENILVLRRPCSVGQNILPDETELPRRLAEAELALVEMTAELASSYESLVALFRYSSELGAHLDLKEFSQRLLRDLVQIAEAGCAVLRLLSADGKKLETFLVLPEKKVGELPDILLAANFASAEIRAARYRQDVWFGPEEPLAAEDPLRRVLPVGNGVCHSFFVADQLVGTIMLGRLAAEKPFTSAQVNLLHSFVDFLAIQMVNARLLDERAAARVTRRELQIAAEIQSSLLPEKLPACAPFALAATCQNALQVGGDFYDVIATDDGAVLLVIADVMGKGVPAALFAAVLRSTIRSMPQLFSQPGELLAAANRILFSDLSRVNMFVTAKVVFLNPSNSEIISASAGHCPLMIGAKDAPDENILEEPGFPLGIEPDAVYAPTTNHLPPGALALLYTDGLSETRNENGELLGEKKLRQWLAQTAGETTDAVGAGNFFTRALAVYRGKAPLLDDQTFILIRHEK